MSDEQDLSPWAHPKARAWFKLLFERTHFGFILEDVLKQPAEDLPPEQIRAILAMSVLLSRQETWPEEHRSVLNMVLEKSREVARRIEGNEKKPARMTLSEHRERRNVSHEMLEEIEILRRRMGRSFKTNHLDAPRTWRPFWT